MPPLGLWVGREPATGLQGVPVSEPTHVSLVWEAGIISDVPVPRVPIVGERFIGPDGFGKFTVSSVTYEYTKGFYYEPTAVVVVLVRS
jgi:hypothetical protein